MNLTFFIAFARFAQCLFAIWYWPNANSNVRWDGARLLVFSFARCGTVLANCVMPRWYIHVYFCFSYAFMRFYVFSAQCDASQCTATQHKQTHTHNHARKNSCTTTAAAVGAIAANKHQLNYVGFYSVANFRIQNNVCGRNISVKKNFSYTLLRQRLNYISEFSFCSLALFRLFDTLSLFFAIRFRLETPTEARWAHAHIWKIRWATTTTATQHRHRSKRWEWEYNGTVEAREQHEEKPKRFILARDIE